jgi:2-oxoglutarate dehydrogenase E1 component
MREFGWARFKGLIARKKSASPATGFLKVHVEEQAALVNKAFE